MRYILVQKIKYTLGKLRLNRKIQISLILILAPLFVLFVLVFGSIYSYNQQYDKIISNASEAGRFSIKFKQEFDYDIYLLIAGHAKKEVKDIYRDISNAREIATDLVKNTNLTENKKRAESILRLLNNLEKYLKRIEKNKMSTGHYDENISIWENDVQIVTGLIQSTVLEYAFYETSGMELVRSRLSESLRKITLLILVTFGVLALASIFLSVIIPNSIVRPINHLNEITNQVAKGDLTVRADVMGGEEVANLAGSLNTMIEKIENLLIKVKIDETNLHEAELELLQAQINPHFLYNTLDTIVWLAESGKQNGVVDMVSALSDFFRTSLNYGSGIITLREEERHVRSYLQIQHVRYQDILEYNIEFSEEIKEVRIPKITLQPLVENALYHGIKNRRGKGSIVVLAYKNNDDVIITVSDNGIGMTEEKLNQVRSRLRRKSRNEAGNEKHESYGIYNVNERIKLRFGEKYGLTIMSEYGRGTCIEVKMPFEHV